MQCNQKGGYVSLGRGRDVEEEVAARRNIHPLSMASTYMQRGKAGYRSMCIYSIYVLGG
jgi:hypothetical protein